MRIRRSLNKYYLVILNPMQIWKVLPSKKLPLIHKQILTLGDLNAIKKYTIDWDVQIVMELCIIWHGTDKLLSKSCHFFFFKALTLSLVWTKKAAAMSLKHMSKLKIRFFSNFIVMLVYMKTCSAPWLKYYTSSRIRWSFELVWMARYLILITSSLNIKNEKYHIFSHFWGYFQCRMCDTFYLCIRVRLYVHEMKSHPGMNLPQDEKYVYTLVSSRNEKSKISSRDEI